jgi:hypothetical protein
MPELFMNDPLAYLKLRPAASGPEAASYHFGEDRIGSFLIKRPIQVLV